MRILAIRGQNLASLAEEFEVDLASGPLAGAGLFAITGPTGAGKSTLLDALCLALFDRAPRLSEPRREAAAIGRDEITSIKANDVRSLVRRGASGGWAEVDFEGSDGRRYRARWTARRARQRVDGRFQDQQMTLVCLDTDEKLGGTRKETSDAIRAKLGLSFDQFRRSALLAQGDFAAFLRADAAERADLLERMTGTEIYGVVSMAAFQRAKELVGIARAREDEMARVNVMDEAARAAADEGAIEAARRATEAAERLRAVEAAAAWGEARASLAAAVEAARTTEASARAAMVAAEPDRARVVRLEAAETLRAPWEARGKARDEERRAESAEAAAVADSEAAASRLDEASRLDDEARAAREVSEASRAIAAVRAVVREARGGASGGAGSSGGASRERDVARASAAQVREELVASRARLDDARRWLAANAMSGELAADWPRLQRALDREAGAAEAIARARADEDRLVAAVAEADRRADTADASRAACAASLEAAHALAAAAEGKRTTRPADLRRALEAATRRAEATVRLVELTAAARAADDEASANERGAREARTRAAAAEAIRAQARSDEERATAALREAERAADQLRLAAGLTHARAELVDGEPCPLCGAETHPWAGRGALDEIVRAQEARVDELRADVRAAQGRGAAAIAEGRAATDEAEAGELAAQAARAARTKAADGWRRALAGLGELPLVEDPAVAAAARLATDHAAAAAAQRDRARDALATAEKIDADAGHAQQLALARRVDLDHAQAAALEAAQAVSRLGAQLTDARRALADAGKAREAAREDLAVALGAWPGWRERLDRERARFAAELARGVTAWTERAVDVDAAAAQIDSLASRTAALRLDAERAAAAARAAQIAAVEARARARAARLAADEVLASARAAATAVPRGRESLDDVSHDGAIPHTDITPPHADITPPHTDLAPPLADDELAVLFSAGPGAAARLRDSLAVLDQRAALAAAVTTERRRALADHDLARPTAEPDASLEHARAAARDAADRARDATLALHLDDDARTRRAAAAAALDEARAVALPFETLRDLIGSADGKAFRTFAQGLTLDALLVAANAHLDQLAPRYQLERVPRSDLELQVVDRDLGDDVRAVQSLSGGESFLVSLALALALSALSAHDVRVRTLLIDEGFGTLDPAALDVALAVLDALQASGRQVGIISHVPGLAERVGAQVAVRPVGGGRSVVRVRAAS